MTRRIACILVKEFSFAALVRANPELRDLPCIVVDKNSLSTHLCAVSSQAQALGIRRDMTVTQAQAIVPELLILERSLAAEQSALDALREVAYSFSPMVEVDSKGIVWLDISTSAPKAEQEKEIGYELTRRAESIGLQASVGIASGKKIAYLAARCSNLYIVEHGNERQFLDRISIAVLEPDEDIASRLRRWGIRRLGDVAKLDARAMGSRLGTRGVAMVELAQGEDQTYLTPEQHRPVFEEKFALEYAVENLEALGFVMHAMLRRLTERLSLYGLIAGDIELELGLSDYRRDRRHISVVASTNQARLLLALIIMNLERKPPPMAVEEIRIAVEPRVPRPLQGNMFAPSIPAPSQIELTLARLASLCGPEGIGTVVPINSYRPEIFERRPFAPDLEASPSQTASTRSTTPLVIRVIRPAEEIEVICSPRRVPERIRWRLGCARVINASGPWRRCGEWWHENNSLSENEHQPDLRSHLNAHPVPLKLSPFARDYYDLALDNGGIYRVFYDLRSSRWFLDGIYD